MTEGTTVELDSSSWKPVDFIPHEARHRSRSTDMARSSALPELRPGQLWFTEIGSTEPTETSLEYRALTSANVVIYDRALAPTVGRFLPLGGYAEPAAASRSSFDAVWQRCLRFARDGWSVARLVHSSRERVGEVRRLSELLLGYDLAPDLPIVVFANLGGGVYERSETVLGELGAAVSLADFAQSLPLTIVCDVIGSGVAPYTSAASTNGLAG